MAYPNAAAKLFSFTGFAAASPASPLPGTSMDTEFGEARRAISEIVAYLEGSDLDATGGLKALTVALTQLDPELVLALFGTATPDLSAYETEIVAARDAALAAQAAAEAAAAGIVDNIIDTRAALLALTVDAGVNLIRTGGYATFGDGGAALYKRASSEPAHALKAQSADTAWWELVPDPGGINIKQAGAVADDTTDSAAAIQACVDYFYYSDAGIPTINQPGGRVLIPAGEYFVGSRIELKHTVIIEGHGIGAGGVRSGSKLRWPANTAGFVVNRYNTLNNATEGTATGMADGTIIRNLYLKGGGGTNAVGQEGVRLRARGVVENCTIASFAGHGIRIEAGAGAGGDDEGNANNWRVNNCRVEDCYGSGMYVNGPDANAGVATLLDCSQNGRWGIWDSSFLGNTYVGCHVASNGFATLAGNGTNSSIVWYGGNRYFANVAASEANLVATTPGTDTNIWTFYQAGAETGGQIPTWLPAQPVGTYFHGGPYRTDNINARNVLLGCYSESGGGMSQIVHPTTMLGGLHAANISPQSTGIYIAGSDISVAEPRFINPNTTYGMKITLNSADNTAMWIDLTGEVTFQMMKWLASAKTWLLGVTSNNDSTAAAELLNANSTKTYGRSAAVDAGIGFPNGFWSGVFTNARQITTVGAKPTTGNTAIGDLFLNNVVGSNGTLGWLGVTQGAPGALRALWKVPTVDSCMSLPQHTVASLPAAAAGNKDHVAYCSDGDTGSPCLAVSDGTIWARVALGAAVSAT